MRTLCSGLLSALALGLFLFCLSGVSGCDSKPADGTVVQDAGSTNKESDEEADKRRMLKNKNAHKVKKQPRK